MMDPFLYEALPVRVIFGTGTVSQIRAEAERLEIRRALVLSTPGRAEAQAHEIAALLGERSAGVHAAAVMHTPVDVTERAVRVVRQREADAIVAVGGGSTMGLGKAIALRTNLPQIVLPTSYAGSEVTPILGETRDGVKTTQRTLKVLPEVVIYDVDLTMDLPPAIAATSGMNAIAHAVRGALRKGPEPSDIADGRGGHCLARPRIAEDRGRPTGS
jgi:maleylacetate reductase